MKGLEKKSSSKKKTNVLEEIEDDALRRAEERKKARLRTRGPYRKACVETQNPFCDRFDSLDYLIEFLLSFINSSLSKYVIK